MSDLFISDLHLDENRRDITDSFLSFLENTVPTATRFFILGDFFEVWLGDDHETDFNQEIITALATINVPKYIMHGNRDFLLGERFCQQTGFELLPDPTVIEVSGNPVLLMHGDSLCTLDQEYMAVRKMLRNVDVQRDLLSKSIEERSAIARSARKDSQTNNREKAEDIMDVTADEVSRVMQENGVSLLIHGHTHRPAIHDLEVGGRFSQRIVLGDWDQQGWYLMLEGKDQNLVSFDIGEAD